MGLDSDTTRMLVVSGASSPTLAMILHKVRVMQTDGESNHQMSHGGTEEASADFVREVVTMAVYLSLSLLAVVVAIPKSVLPEEHGHAALQVAATGLALFLAHHLALRMSSRLIDQGVLGHDSLHALKAQVVGTVPVILLASLPIAIWGASPGAAISMYLLVGVVAMVGYLTARRIGLDGLRTLIYVGLVVAALAVVVTIKLAVGH